MGEQKSDEISPRKVLRGNFTHTLTRRTNTNKRLRRNRIFPQKGSHEKRKIFPLNSFKSSAQHAAERGKDATRRSCNGIRLLQSHILCKFSSRKYCTISLFRTIIFLRCNASRVNKHLSCVNQTTGELSRERNLAELC